MTNPMDLAKTLEGLNADCEDAQANGTPATDEFNRMARTICYAYRTGQLIVAQAGDVETVARAIMIARDNGGCIVKDWQKEAKDNCHVAQALRQAQAAIAAMPSLAAKDAEITRLREALDMAAFRMQMLVDRMRPDEDGRSAKALSQTYVEQARQALGETP